MHMMCKFHFHYEKLFECAVCKKSAMLFTMRIHAPLGLNKLITCSFTTLPLPICVSQWTGFVTCRYQEVLCIPKTC